MLEARLRLYARPSLPERIIEEEELALVHRAVEIEMEDIEAGKSKTYSFEEIKKLAKS